MRNSENDRILELYNKDFSLRRISSILDISRGSIKYRLINELNVDYKPKRIFSLEWRNKIKIAREKQVSPNIGKKFSYLHKRRISSGKKGKSSQAIIDAHSSDEYREKLRIANLGSKCYLWKGGITPVKKRIRDSYRWRQWREEVFQRDDYVCKKCGFRNGNGEHRDLHPDHIIPFSVLLSNIRKEVSIDNLYEVAMQDNSLWDIDNGRTLCYDCHRKTETWGINQYKRG